MALPPFRVKALYDYASTEADDLNFPNGQIITVTDVEDDDWYFGEYVNTGGSKEEGLFPKNFVKTYEPETPPRPSRLSKSRKELETSALTSEPSKAFASQEPKTSLPSTAHEDVETEQPMVIEQLQKVPREQDIKSPQPEPATAAPKQIETSKPAPTAAAKKAPPPAVEKPTSGSFRDRINAFNKPAAPPVAPMKPSGLGASSGSGFIKKPFVAPPPSKNAFVPPPREQPAQKPYRREEDPELATETSREIENEEQPTQSQAVPAAVEEEEQPKPTSLKDRIALLQKQQMEQAARHAEAGQKEKKPKRPAKKQLDTEERAVGQDEDPEDENLERMNNENAAAKPSMESPRDAPVPVPRAHTRPHTSREATPVGSPVAAPSRDFMNDPNDADQSGIGETEDGEELSTGRDESDEKPSRKASIPLPRPPQSLIREADVGDEEDNAEEDDAGEEEEEDDDVDPEVKRRMEIRERMAKMSGGMGMAGMFGPPAGLPPKSSTKQVSGSSDRKASGNSNPGQADSPASRAPPIQMVSMPGLQKVRSPEQSESQSGVSKEEAVAPKSTIGGRDPEEVPDMEEVTEDLAPPPRSSTERPVPPPIPQNRPAPAPSNQGGAPPPPLSAERPVPPPPSESRPIPRPLPTQPLSPSEGSESDDEMSLHKRSSLKLPPGNDARPISRGGPPPIPNAGPPLSLPSRPAVLRPQSSEYSQNPEMQSTELSPTSPTVPAAAVNRSSRAPPIPGADPAMPSAPQNRAPPPPPPSNVLPPRISTGNVKVPPMPPPLPKSRDLDASDEEVTEYEGDYDTDMASSATHKDALKSHARGSSLEDDILTDETSFHHASLPYLGPVTSSTPRALPPPPPNQPPKTTRPSSDMPRNAPPPPPPPKEQAYDEGEEEDYDPYKYTRSSQRQPQANQNNTEGSTTPKVESPNPMIAISPQQRTVQPPAASNPQQYTALPNMPVPSGSNTGTRQSMEAQRTSTTIRRSAEGPRPSGEQSFIAGNVDLSHSSQWWTQPDSPPPLFRNRQDLIFESEETSTTRRGGKQEITKTVYVLFMDYSQTVITAHFETKDPTHATLDQRHDPPPQNLRQDQLENAHARFGSRIANGAASKEGSVIGDGSPNALVLELMSVFPDILLPVGLRAYGALVYANLANASVRQFDEIRPGDIVTFRNARFQGHRGTMHSKYSNEIGRPDHVGVVIDWDGTKKKIRAWEQGRESRKVKSESFKLGDMRSGEVKVWRAMARSWVGWEGEN